MANQPPRQPEIPIFESTDELIDKLKALRGRWIPSVKKAGNDGAVGNTLENLLNVDENNLPITNKDEWELKARRRSSSSLTTLLHNDPSPRGAKLIPLRLLPYYGWTHEKAGKIYPKTEKSFRSTTNAVSYTDRGFIVIVDRKEEMIRFSFNADKVDKNRHSEWLKSIEKTVGLGEISPQPFWVFKRLMCAVDCKLKSMLYVVAESKIEESNEYFLFNEVDMLTEFDFEMFIKCIEAGKIVIDFDARTGHNHGTKFRIKRNYWPSLYKNCLKIPL